MNKEQAFHAAVGMFVISWGDMENGLDFLALLIRRHFPVRRHQKAPQKLCEKIDFIKKRVDSLADSNECINLLSAIFVGPSIHSVLSSCIALFLDHN